MRLNKTLLKFLLLFIFNLNHAQPGMNQLRNAPDITFTIKDVTNKKITFVTKDSVNFYSLNKQYSFSLSMNYIKYSNLNNVKDSISKTSPMSFNGDKDTFFRINPYGFYRNSKNLEGDDKYEFRLVLVFQKEKEEANRPIFMSINQLLTLT